MPINLTTPVSLTNLTRLVFTRIRVDEDAQTLDFVVSLRTSGGGSPPDAAASSRALQIRAGDGDQVRRNASPASGGSHDDLLVFVPGGVTRANAFTDAYNSLKTSRAAFETHTLTAGYIHSSLAGT